jgi:uncharacterized protein
MVGVVGSSPIAPTNFQGSAILRGLVVCGESVHFFAVHTRIMQSVFSHQKAIQMSISMYAASIPVFKQMLSSMNDVLAKAQAHADAKKIDANVLLQSRLFPDMFPLIQQVQIAVEFARSVTLRLAGHEVTKLESNEATFADLQKLIATTASQLDSFAANQIDGTESRDIVLRPGTPKEKRLTGQVYLLNYALPQFFFHVTTTYAILRHNGVELGKRDYMGVY